MDMSSITAAHRLPDNQFKFDQTALDQSILRAEEQRARLGRVWTEIGARISSTLVYLDFTTAMAPTKRQE